jgi:hypothetical protein
VVSLSITGSDGQSIALRREGSWVLDGSDGFLARESSVTDFLAKLLAIKADRLVTRTAASQSRLRVSDRAFERHVTIATGSGVQYDLFLGTSAGYGATHFRLGGHDETYLTNAVTSWAASTTPSTWIDTGYLDVAATAKRIQVANASGAYALIVDGQGKWTLEDLGADETVNEATVTSIVNRATVLQMVRPLGKADRTEYGLGSSTTMVTVTTADGEITWRVGAFDEASKTYVAKASSSEFFVRVSDYTVRDLVGKGRQDLLEVPATPTPEAATK